MASNLSLKNLVILALALVLSVQSTQGAITCEHLDQDTCTFAVSSSGKRCVLEKQVKRSGEEAYTCRTSEILAEKLKDWVETDDCVKACGLDRTTLGISSDSLLESRFTKQLCSYECYESCPNIADLYFNLAAGEGKHHLPFNVDYTGSLQVYFFQNYVKHNGQIHGEGCLRSSAALDMLHHVPCSRLG